MNVEFFAADPSEKARSALDDIIGSGVDQVAIACAFCTSAGIELLFNHVKSLTRSESFVVVAAAPPTNYAGLGPLAHAIPGNLYVHWGALMPNEIETGSALMHSKVFYARHGKDCSLWVGSHNLTANATQGGNCEAAVILRGKVDEKPFVEAMRHLNECRDEAQLYDPNATPPDNSERTDLIAIHAEAERPPSVPLPWHIHLCLTTPAFDKLIRPPTYVRLFLYPPNTTRSGWQFATPFAAYSGALTGQNLTASNPHVGRNGISARWQAAQFRIMDRGFALVVEPDCPPEWEVTTQAVLTVDAESDSHESLFSEAPRVESKLITGERRLSEVDADMARFFKRQSVEEHNLVHVPYTGRQQIIKVYEEEARDADYAKIQMSLAPDSRVKIERVNLSETQREKRHPFIYRAKYRLRDH